MKFLQPLERRLHGLEHQNAISQNNRSGDVRQMSDAQLERLCGVDKFRATHPACSEANIDVELRGISSQGN